MRIVNRDNILLVIEQYLEILIGFKLNFSQKVIDFRSIYFAGDANTTQTGII